MKSNLSYLLSLKGKQNNLIRDTWVVQGKMTASDFTKKYIKDNIFKIECDEETSMNGSLVYCAENYTVDELHPAIDWSFNSPQGDKGEIGDFQGTATPNFTLLLTKEELDAITEPVDYDYVPYADSDEEGGILISDDELYTILTECGVPFLRIDELEYTADAIKRYCIKPAMDIYFGFFPIIKESVIGQMPAGSSFKEEFPENAYAAVPYYVLGTVGGGGFGSGAFSLVREQMMYGGGSYGGAFGGGVSYHKPVPGFVGIQNKDAGLMALSARQGYSNFFRRERVTTVKENGKKYATGYTTLGGSLNIKWLCSSNDVDDIKYSLLPQFRDLAKAKVLRNLGMLRALVKSDLPGNIDFSLYTSRADSLEQKVMDIWEKSPTSQNLALMRGGL